MSLSNTFFTKAVRWEDIERTIRCAAAPQTPVAKSYAGSTVLANLMVGKYVDSLPFYRQIEMMNHLGMDGYAVCDYYEGKAINYAIADYDRLCRYVIDGRYRIDTNLVENQQRPVALTRKNYDAAEDAAVMYTMMGCCKLAGVNAEAWLTYFLDHVHEYDNDCSLDIVDFLPSSLVSKGLLKTSESLQYFSKTLRKS